MASNRMRFILNAIGFYRIAHHGILCDSIILKFQKTYNTNAIKLDEMLYDAIKWRIITTEFNIIQNHMMTSVIIRPHQMICYEFINVTELGYTRSSSIRYNKPS